MHEPLLAAPSAGFRVPGSHGAGWDVPGSQKWPMGHGPLQVPSVRSLSFPKLPGMHRLRHPPGRMSPVKEPVLGIHRPSGQSRQIRRVVVLMVSISSP